MHASPNIILLVPDELNTRAMGCYGQKLPVTPFMDSLAERSALFESFFTTHPKCVPARTSLLTATYPHVYGHRTLDLPVKSHELNLVRQLKDHGYETVMIGRNHMVDEETLPLTFDEYHNPKGTWKLERDDPDSVPAGSYLVGEDPTPIEKHEDVVRTRAATAWIDSRKDSGKPFYMQVNYTLPHPPYSVPKPYYGTLDRSKIKLPPSMGVRDHLPAFHQRLRESYHLEEMTEEQWRELIGCYLEMTTLMDDQVKTVYESLERNGMLENTLFVVWVDHGDFVGEFGLTEKWDTALYDCITHVPFMIHAPGRFTPKRIPAFMETVDVLPTLLDLAGVELPKGIQGKSYVPVLRGEKEELRDLVFCQGGQEKELVARPTPVDHKPRPCRAYLKKQEALVAEPEINLKAKMIRDRDFKYIYHLSDFEELYDLNADPWECRNLAADPDAADRLQTYRKKLMVKLIEAETVEPYQELLDS